MDARDEVTAAQAATLTGLSERTIRRKIAAGVIPARRIGPNRFAIKVADLRMSHPIQALALRVEALERRIELLEARLQAPAKPESLETPRAPEAQPSAASAATSGVPAHFSTTDVQQLLAQLAYETARLARSIPFAQLPAQEQRGATTAAVEDDQTPEQSSGPGNGEAM
jgi:excisionase family DNA binding protein